MIVSLHFAVIYLWSCLNNVVHLPFSQEEMVNEDVEPSLFFCFTFLLSLHVPSFVAKDIVLN